MTAVVYAPRLLHKESVVTLRSRLKHKALSAAERTVGAAREAASTARSEQIHDVDLIIAVAVTLKREL